MSWCVDGFVLTVHRLSTPPQSFPALLPLSKADAVVMCAGDASVAGGNAPSRGNPETNYILVKCSRSADQVPIAKRQEEHSKQPGPISFGRARRSRNTSTHTDQHIVFSARVACLLLLENIRRLEREQRRRQD